MSESSNLKRGLRGERIPAAPADGPPRGVSAQHYQQHQHSSSRSQSANTSRGSSSSARRTTNNSTPGSGCGSNSSSSHHHHHNNTHSRGGAVSPTFSPVVSTGALRGSPGIHLPELKQFMQTSTTSLRFLVSKKQSDLEQEQLTSEDDDQAAEAAAIADRRAKTEKEDDDECEVSAILDSLEGSATSVNLHPQKISLSTTAADTKKSFPLLLRKKPVIISPFERVTEAQIVTLRNTSDLQQLRWHAVSNASSQFTVKQPGNKELLQPGEETQIVVSVRKHAKSLQPHSKLLIQYGSEGILVDKKTDTMKDRVSQEGQQQQQRVDGDLVSAPVAAGTGKNNNSGSFSLKQNHHHPEKNFGALKGQSWKGRNFDMLHSQTLVIDVFVDVDIPRAMTLVKSIADSGSKIQDLQQGILSERTRQREMRRYREEITETQKDLMKELTEAQKKLSDFNKSGGKEYKIHLMHFFVFTLMMSSTWLLGYHLPHLQVVPKEGGRGSTFSTGSGSSGGGPSYGFSGREPPPRSVHGRPPRYLSA